MELLELTEKVKELFEVQDLSLLGAKLLECAMSDDETKKDAFVELVGGDLSRDYFQKIYQYYLADRKGKKQDFTPKCLAEFRDALLPELMSGKIDVSCEANNDDD